LGYIIGRKLVLKAEETIRNPVRLVFGKIGSTISYFVQRVVSRIVPQPLRTAIKTGFQTMGKAAVSVVKAGAGKIVSAAKSFVGKIFGGRR